MGGGGGWGGMGGALAVLYFRPDFRSHSLLLYILYKSVRVDRVSP